MGIEVRGHSSRLKVNYRTTQAIRAVADKVQPTAESGAAEREERDAVSFLTGSQNTNGHRLPDGR